MSLTKKRGAGYNKCVSVPGSFNGRTAVFGAAYRGSNPCPGTSSPALFSLYLPCSSPLSSVFCAFGPPCGWQCLRARRIGKKRQNWTSDARKANPAWPFCCGLRYRTPACIRPLSTCSFPSILRKTFASPNRGRCLSMSTPKPGVAWPKTPRRLGPGTFPVHSVRHKNSPAFHPNIGKKSARLCRAGIKGK